MRLERRKFAAWLAAKSPTDVVGKQRDCHACPIAAFYLETSGGCEVVIFDNGDGYRIDRGYSIRPLPTWASRFIWKIDDGQTSHITACRALEILGVSA